MKNRILAGIILTMLMLPVAAEVLPVPVDTQNVEQSQVEVSEDTLNVENMNPNSFPLKQPVSKRKIAKKFLLAMAGVATSSFSIYFILTIYNRIREGFVAPVKTPEGEISLETPDDLDSAVRTFLEKTNWKG